MERIIEVSKIQLQEKIVKVAKVTQKVVDRVVQNQTQTIEVVKPRIVQKTIQRKKPLIQEQIQQVTRIVEEVQTVLRKVQRTVEVPQIQRSPPSTSAGVPSTRTKGS